MNDNLSILDNSVIKYPLVFVHGLAGWGESDDANKITPYWGITTGSLLKDIQKKGYTCIATSVGPMSSAWDRACELYAELTGGTVDYGLVHSKKFNHKRYGRNYEKALLPKWDKDNKINLIGHSFGGATIRLLIELLENGNKEEQEGTPEGNLSPLFKGGNKGLIHAVATLASPHNGTSCFEAVNNSDKFKEIFMIAANFFGSTKLNKLYDTQLEQFRLGTPANEPINTCVSITKAIEFAKKDDNAMFDLSIDGSQKLNDKLHISDDIYYYSFPACESQLNTKGNYIPETRMNPLFLYFSMCIGSYTGITDGGFVIDEKWKKNDGLVNTISSLAPFNEPSKNFNEFEKRQKGIWYVMPQIHSDHLQIVGGMQGSDIKMLKKFYSNLAELLNEDF